MSTIAVVSVVGIAVAVAAIVCVLSVFNGFKHVLTERSNRMLTDIEILPAKSKTLNADSLLPVVRNIAGVKHATDIVSDQALVIYESTEIPVQLYATDFSLLRKMTDIDSLILDKGRYPDNNASFDEAPEGLVAIGPANRLGLYNNDETLFIFTPKRVGTIDPANPLSAFITDSVRVTGVFETGDERFDASTLIVHPDVARALLMYDDSQASAIAVTATPDTDIDRLASKISQSLDAQKNNLTVRTREELQQTTYRMVNIEKWVTFLLLVFMLAIASFNIISTMTMFVLEKDRDIHILRALGMTKKNIGNIFALQSLFVTAIGTVAGLLLGLILSLGQQRFGWLTMGDAGHDGMPPMPYPVKVCAADFPAVIIPIAIVAIITALIAARFAKSRCDQRHL